MSQSVAARRSQSTIAFPTNVTNADGISPQHKRQRSDLTETPHINIDNEHNGNPFASASSTSTVIENISGNDQNTEPEDIDVIRLDRLYNKRDRYTSHISFLKECIEMKKIPNGLVINLEPTIGNHDEEFRTQWYNRLQDFSLTLMQDVVTFAEKTEKEAIDKIATEKEKLGTRKLNNEVMYALNTNSDDRKRILDNAKRKKLQWLKFNRNNITTQNGTRFRDSRQNEFEQNNFNSNQNNFVRNNNNQNGNYNQNKNNTQNNSYAQNNNQAKSNNHLQNSNNPRNNYGETNSYAKRDNFIQNNNPGPSNNDGEQRTWSSLLKKQSHTNLSRKTSRSNLNRSSSRTNMNGNEGLVQSSAQQRQIDELKNEIALLKSPANNGTKNSLEVPLRQRDAPTPTRQVNQRNEVKQTEVISFIEATMLTLHEFKMQLAEQNDSETTHSVTS